MRLRGCVFYSGMIVAGLVLWGLINSGIGDGFPGFLQWLNSSPWAVGATVAILVIGFIKYQLDGFKPEVRVRRQAAKRAEQDHYDEVTRENMRRRK